MESTDAVRRYHEETSHSARSGPRVGSSDPLVASFRPMAPHNRPSPFKRYRDLDRQPLPAGLRPAPDAPAAFDVLAGNLGSAVPASVDVALLARLLYLSTGVTRYTDRGGGRICFRASASAGNLHPVELYAACGPLTGLDAGLYHFDPESFSLGRLRSVDVRSHLARAADDSALRTAGVVIIVTGIPWRTAWKYGERGWRHVFWDAGSLLANLLSVADAYGAPARASLGFVDHDVSHVLGIDGTAELPVAVVAVGTDSPASGAGGTGPTAAPGAPSTDDPASLDHLHPDVDPISPRPFEFPLVTEAQRSGNLDDAVDVGQWRAAATDERAGHLHAAATGPFEGTGSDPTAEPIDELILRRGSTRAMRPETVPNTAIEWPLRAAARPAPLDVLPPSRTLLTHHVAVHGIDGYPAGLYRWTEGALEPRRVETRAPDGAENEARVRNLSASLCLGQPLGGDSAYTVFGSTDLDRVLAALGPRGYRAAHVEAGIVNGRLLLAAHALGYGATGLTFFDGEVRSAFETADSCLLVTAVGAPAYRPRAGGWPGDPVRLDRYGLLTLRKRR